MKNKSSYSKTTIQSNNLIGNNNHRQFIQLQANLGIAQRGGVKYPYYNKQHDVRLVSDINILSSSENKQLIFSERIFSN